MSYTVSLIYGSVRQQRMGIRAAKYLHKKLLDRNYEVHFIDALEYKLPLLDKMYKEYEDGEAPKNMEDIAAKFNASDGFLIVSGEYNHSIPPALKNLLDHFQQEYVFKPSAIACYSAGSFGGVRAAVHLRAIVGELGMPSISSIRPFPKVGSAFDEDGEPKDDKLEKATNRFIDEFEWYMAALQTQRAKGTPF